MRHGLVSFIDVGLRVAFVSVLLALPQFAAYVSAQPTCDSKPIGIMFAAGDMTHCGKNGRNDIVMAKMIQEVIDQGNNETRSAGCKPIPVRILALGDLAYDKGTPEQFECFAQSWGNPELVQHMLPVIGNHDEMTSQGKPFFEFFRKAKNSQRNVDDNRTPVLDSHGQGAGYYAVKFPDAKEGPWKLIGLHYRKTEPKDQQMTWLDAELADNTQKCVLAFAHVHPFSSGRHGHCKTVGNKKKCYLPDKDAKFGQDSTAKRAEAIFKKLYNARASLFLAGHDHNFEQLPRKNPKGEVDPMGVRSFVVGTGGSNLTQVDYDDNIQKELEIFGKFGVLRIELFADRYTWSFLPSDGSKPFAGKVTSDTCNTK